MADGMGRRVGDDGIEEALLGFIGREVASAPEGITIEEHLIETGRVDSLGLLQILSFVDAGWHVDLMAVGDPADLRSIAALAAAIRRERARTRVAVAEGA
jgi:acyl carrier protein